jgi:uncharacterized protein
MEIISINDANSKEFAKICEAVYKNDFDDFLKKFKDHESFLNYPEFGIIGNSSLLHIAAGVGNLKICQHLLKTGIDINIVAPFAGSTVPLHLASSNGHLDVVNWFLANHALVDGVSKSISTPLMDAVVRGHLDIVKKLAAAQPEINRLHLRYLQTATDLAVIWSHAEIAKYLKSLGGIQANDSHIDWSKEFGGGILEFVSETAGRVLPIKFSQIVPSAQNVDLRICKIEDKDKYKLLFTIGLCAVEPRIELFICLPNDWPLHSSIIRDAKEYSFPALLLLDLAAKRFKGFKIEEGLIISKQDKEWGKLPWPNDLNGLVILDHKWNNETVIEKIPDDENVQLLLIVPLKSKDSVFPSGEKLKAFLDKQRHASWGKVILTKTPTNSED